MKDGSGWGARRWEPARRRQTDTCPPAGAPNCYPSNLSYYYSTPLAARDAEFSVTPAKSVRSFHRFPAMAEHWDHASLLAAGPCVSPARSKAMFVAAAPAAAPSCAWSDASEPGSPLNGWEQEEVLYSRTFRQLEPSGIRHSGWLLKAAGDGSQRQWRRRFVYLTADRLCYTPDPDDGGPVRYLAVDRIPVRALPRGYGPKLGVTLVEDRQVGADACQLLLPGMVTGTCI